MSSLSKKHEIIDSDLLRTFYFVVELNSTTKAGQALNLSQSAISHKLKKLEQDLEKTLLSRKGRNFILSPAGEQLYYYAQELLKLNQKIIQQVCQRKEKKELRIGMPFVYWRFMLSKIGIDFFNNNNILVNLHCANSTTLHRLYDDQDIDICLSVRHEELTHGEILTNEKLVWVKAKNSNSHLQRPLPLVVFDEECIYRKIMLSSLEANNIPWEIKMISQDTSAIREAIKNDFGISLLGSRTVDKNLEIFTDSSLPQNKSVDLELRYRANQDHQELISKIKNIFGDS